MDNLTGKKLLILGGNTLTSDIVLKAKELGVYTIVTDWNNPDNPFGDMYLSNYHIGDIVQVQVFIKEFTIPHIHFIKSC